jgi:hypothetical protein
MGGDEYADPLEKLEVEVKFERDRHALTRRFRLSDWRMAPLSTYTKDWDWRHEIKQGDLIDCMDEEKDWYKSTVVDTRTGQNADGEEFPEIYVAFRTYDPEGSKEDEQGRKFFGWSERYDAWQGATDARVQRLHTCHLQYRRAEGANRVHERPADFDDREDVIYCNTEMTCFAAERIRPFARSYVLVDALNLFGLAGGFERILETMLAAKNGIRSVTLDHLVSLTAFLARSQPLWHKQFAASFIDRLTDTLLDALCFVNLETGPQGEAPAVLGPLQARDFDPTVLDMMVDTFVDPTWRRHYTLEMVNRKQCLYRVAAGAALMRLANLRPRVAGIKLVSEAIRSVRQAYVAHRGIGAKDLIAELR